MADGKGIDIHPPSVFFEGCHEWAVFLGLLLELNIAVEVPAKADLDDDKGAFFLVEGAWGGEGCVWDPS